MRFKISAIASASVPLCAFVLAGQVQSQPSPTTRSAATQPALTGFARWEKEISAFEQADKVNPPPKGAIVFTGSSTIRRWDTLARDFPDHQVINRGFGGSEIVDATHFADRIIFPYEPKMVVLRAGGNDIHAGKTPQQVFADYQGFVARIREKLPDADIVFISQSPAPSRWKERDDEKRLNQMVQEFTKTTPHLKYVETYDLSLTPDGQARPELFVADQLHFNAEGYKLLTERVRPALAK
jgi:lysophospholipase L1-like esterase